ncbi:MAG: type transport system permease protein [Actinomycetota bacterium]|nr:type transport system permease protein [Actinomycetota bacterium]
MGELWSARQLLRNLTVRELKVRYKRSAIGFLWSLVNPLLQMAVFSLVFGKLFSASKTIPQFPIFFIVAFLPWAFFQGSVQNSTGAIVGNANLVKKVYFPREVLPVATMLAQFVHLLLAELVLFVVLAIGGNDFLPYLPVFVIATVIVVVLATGFAMLFAALNTAFRDVQELSGVLFLVWFYATPVVYPLSLVPSKWRWVLSLNPMTHVVRLYRYALYPVPRAGGFAWPPVTVVAAGAAFAVAALVLGYVVFGRMAANFAKEV